MDVHVQHLAHAVLQRHRQVLRIRYRTGSRWVWLSGRVSFSAHALLAHHRQDLQPKTAWESMPAGQRWCRTCTTMEMSSTLMLESAATCGRESTATKRL